MTSDIKKNEKNNKKYKIVILINMILSFVVSLLLEAYLENAQLILLIWLLLTLTQVPFLFTKKYTSIKICMGVFCFVFLF